MAPPGNQAANRENKPQPIVSEETGLLDLESMILGESARAGRWALPVYKLGEMLCTGKRLTTQEWAGYYIVMKACSASRAKTAEERA